MFRPMRRAERGTSESEAWAVLDKAEFGILSVTGDDGYPYGMPMTHVVIEGALYFHCALEGHKLDAVRRSPKACFTVTHGPLEGKGNEPADSIGTYQSAVLFGTVSELPTDQVAAPLLEICKRFSPGRVKDVAYFEKYAPRVKILRFDVEHICGKQLLVT